VLRLELFRDDETAICRLAEEMATATCGRKVGELLRFHPPRPWVAEIVGKDPKYKYARSFLRAYKDYSEANSVGSRGVYLLYTLEEGCVYEVKEQINWRRWDRYFCTVRRGRIVRMAEDEVNQWLKYRLT